MSSTHLLTGAMQDGRFFTDYSPVCRVNAEIAKNANIQSWNSTQYRDYLQKNGLSLLQSKNYPCGKNDCTDNGIAIKSPTTQISHAYTNDAEL
jgi:hypothetical protein